MSYLKKTSLLSILFLAACFPKEEAVEPSPRIGKSVTLFTGVAPHKDTVTFYSLIDSSIVTEVSPMAWDFYIDEDVVRLNYFRSMRVAKFDDTWDKLEDTVGLDFRYLTHDSYSGLSQWQLAEGQIYVVDYGLDRDFNPIVLTSVRFERTAGGIKIWHTPLGSDYPVFEEINQSSFYYNLRDKQSLDLPTEKEYDLAFGKYTDLVTIEGVTLEYPVYGTILGDAIGHELNQPFEDDVDPQSLDAVNLQKDIIGWDWKNFNRSGGTSGIYEIIEDRTYVVVSNGSFKYKLRFVNFYNDQLVSGHPTFEWELL
jgi:hypothetical protein